MVKVQPEVRMVDIISQVLYSEEAIRSFDDSTLAETNTSWGSNNVPKRKMARFVVLLFF